LQSSCLIVPINLVESENFELTPRCRVWPWRAFEDKNYTNFQGKKEPKRLKKKLKTPKFAQKPVVKNTS
jgi:hypothetical protein